jgi:probable selenium-dependent hydroxylase accessory protein YqeC
VNLIKPQFPGDQIWLPLLTSGSSNIIAITGGGGKTSLLYYLGRLLAAHGIKAILSVTTKLFRPIGGDHQVLFADSANSLVQIARKAGCGLTTIAAGIDSADTRKLTGLPPEWFNEAAESLPDVMFLIEADGSAGKSLKGYLEHEPVVPSSTSLIIPVVGVDVVGHLLTADFVHRAAIAAAVTGQPLGAVITTDVVVKLLLSPVGYRRGFPTTARTLFFLNKVESDRDYTIATSIATAVFAVASELEGIVAGSIVKDQFSICLPNRERIL